MMTHQSDPSFPQATEIHRNPDASLRAEGDGSETEAGAASPGHPLPGRQAVGALLERSFPGVFGSLADLRRVSGVTGWRVVVQSLRLASVQASALLRTWRNRSRERWYLTRMSERELHDIGLTGLQIVREVNKPFWQA